MTDKRKEALEYIKTALSFPEKSKVPEMMKKQALVRLKALEPVDIEALLDVIFETKSCERGVLKKRITSHLREKGLI